MRPGEDHVWGHGGCWWDVLVKRCFCLKVEYCLHKVLLLVLKYDSLRSYLLLKKFLECLGDWRIKKGHLED